jgi:hypothetical protein
MEILNKANAIEIIFIILMAIFAITLISLVVLDQLNIIKTPAKECYNTCSLDNKTAKYMGEGCRCCDKVNINKEEFGTVIESNCYMIFTNETKSN